MFPEMGLPLHHPFEIGILHEINHPAIRDPSFMENPVYIYIYINIILYIYIQPSNDYWCLF